VEALMTEQVTFSTGHGLLAKPASGTGPGVLVAHAWWGLTPFFAGLCDRLAAAGFVAVAPDLYGDAQTADTIPDAEKLSDNYDREQAWAIVNAGLDFLKGQAFDGPLGAMGFSLGASWALALEDPALKAIVAFYSGHDPDLYTAQAAVLCHFAADDPYEDADFLQDMVAAIRAKGIAVTDYTYPGTTHWFMEDNRPQFNPEAAALAWDRTLAFYREHLGGAGGGKAGFG
jgi:carboxymethylenebutenolidase